MYAMLTNGDSTIGVCTTISLCRYPQQTYVFPGAGLWSMLGIYWVFAFSTASGRGLHTIHSAVLQPFNHYGGAYCCWGLEESPDLSAFPAWQGWMIFSSCGYTHLTPNLWWALKVENSGVMVGYEVGKFTCTSSALYFIA